MDMVCIFRGDSFPSGASCLDEKHVVQFPIRFLKLRVMLTLNPPISLRRRSAPRAYFLRTLHPKPLAYLPSPLQIRHSGTRRQSIR